jgi:hypothetical protein
VSRFRRLAGDYNYPTVLVDLDPLYLDASRPRSFDSTCQVSLAEYAGAARQVCLSMHLSI